PSADILLRPASIRIDGICGTGRTAVAELRDESPLRQCAGRRRASPLLVSSFGGRQLQVFGLFRKSRRYAASDSPPAWRQARSSRRKISVAAKGACADRRRFLTPSLQCE